MIYQLRLSKAELDAVREGLTTRLYALDDIKAETLKNPDEYTTDLWLLYDQKQKDMRRILEKITLLEG